MKGLPAWITFLAVLTWGVVETGAAMVYSMATPRRATSQPSPPLIPTPNISPVKSGTSNLYEITAYSHGCTLPRSGVEPVAARTASGLWPIVGKTVAADPSHAFGREVLIEGLGYWTVHDRGAAITGRKLDLFLNTCREAREFGRQWRHVYLVPLETTLEAVAQEMRP